MATLGFSTNWPKQMGGNKTGFIPKILNSLISTEEVYYQDYSVCRRNDLNYKQLATFPLWEEVKNAIPKHRTIREDAKNLWKPGRKIHMVVFNRTKNRFQFAPVLQVKAVQYIRILWSYDEELKMNTPCLYLGEKSDHSDLMPWYYPTYGEKEMNQLALNDGFENTKQFYQWFNSDFTGKIIHWTKLKYKL